MNGLTFWRIAPFRSVRSGARELVARQRLLQHGDERSVAGQEDGTRLAERPAAGRDVQADERLAGAGHAGDEDDRLLGRGPGLAR